MLRNDCVVFYHASPVPGLKVIEPSKKTDRYEKRKQYACFASSPAQAFYWANLLSASKGGGTWYIYEVAVPHREIVEDCRGGYHFEGVGKLTFAMNVTEHQDVDGEVCIFRPVQVSGVFATVHFEPETLTNGKRKM